jgi:hypothetical protein
MIFYSKHFQIFFLFFVGFWLLSFSLVLPTASQVIISPKGELEQNAISIEAVRGESSVKEVEIKNVSNQDINVNLEIKPLIHVENGAIAPTSDDSQITKILSIGTNRLAISSQSSAIIPIIVSVPQDAPLGEFASSFLVIEEQKGSENSVIKNKISRGLRVYTHIKETQKTIPNSITTIKDREDGKLEFEVDASGVSMLSRLRAKLRQGDKNFEFSNDVIEKRKVQFFVKPNFEIKKDVPIEFTYYFEPLSKNSSGVERSEEKTLSIQPNFGKDSQKNAPEIHQDSKNYLTLVGVSAFVIGFVVVAGTVIRYFKARK